MYGSTFSPLCDVLEHKNHIFSESLSSGDDNDQDKDMQKDEKQTQIKTKNVLQTSNVCYISTGPRCPWGPVSGSRCLSVTELFETLLMWLWLMMISFDRYIFELGDTNIQVGYPRKQEFHISYNKQTTMVENKDHLL